MGRIGDSKEHYANRSIDDRTGPWKALVSVGSRLLGRRSARDLLCLARSAKAGIRSPCARLPRRQGSPAVPGLCSLRHLLSLAREIRPFQFPTRPSTHVGTINAGSTPDLESSANVFELQLSPVAFRVELVPAHRRRRENLLPQETGRPPDCRRRRPSPGPHLIDLAAIAWWTWLATTAPSRLDSRPGR